jgi:hypothetical protein
MLDKNTEKTSAKWSFAAATESAVNKTFMAACRWRLDARESPGGSTTTQDPE